MSIIDQATNHFRNLLDGDMECVNVPEWGDKDKPLKIYYKKVINFKAQEKIFKLVNEGKSSEAICLTLILRALDEFGKPLFRQADMPNLMHEVDPDTVSYTHLTLPTILLV